jgi:flagellar basal-body rod protein FlgC
MQISSSVSAIRASTLRMDISAHDVANINTPNFSQSRPVQTSQKPGTEISAIQKIKPASPEFSATDLAEETAEQIKSEKGLKANASVIKTQDRMMADTINLVV